MTDDKTPEKPITVNYSSNAASAKKGDKPAGQPALELNIAAGVAKEKKPSLGKKFREQFAGDSASTVGQYILIDVVVPAVKNLIWDIGSEGLKKFLFGGSNRPSSGVIGASILGSRSGTNYTKYSGGASQQREITPATRATNDFSDVLVPTRAEGEEVLDQLQNYIDQYGVVSVNDYYAALGISADFTAVKYGWKSISSAEVRHTREGYLLVMPRPQILE